MVEPVWLALSGRRWLAMRATTPPSRLGQTQQHASGHIRACSRHSLGPIEGAYGPVAQTQVDESELAGALSRLNHRPPDQGGALLGDRTAMNRGVGLTMLGVNPAHEAGCAGPANRVT